MPEGYLQSKTRNMKKIKIYGERNTGTNYLTNLVDKNFLVNQLQGVVPNTKFWTFSERTINLYFFFTKKKNLGWKHSSVILPLIQNYSDIEHIYFITLTKNPYTYLLSLYKHPYHYIGTKPSSFSEFIRSKWTTQYRDFYKNKFFENPIYMWNYKNRTYLNLMKKFPTQTYNLTYESLLKDYKLELNKIQKLFHLEYKTEEVSNYTHSTKEKNKSHTDYQNYYLNEAWKKELTDEDIDYINKHLDMDIMHSFGYTKLPTAFSMSND